MVEVFLLNNVGVIISGEYVFYVVFKGKEEYLDGIVKFMYVWWYEEGVWIMVRILSYDYVVLLVDFKNEQFFL